MPSRKNLVIVRAGDASLHEQWLDGDEERNWDLIVNYFGDDPERYRRDDVRRIDSKSVKWPALQDLILELGDDLTRYERVWLPDDDLRVTKAGINSLFDIFEQYELAFAQPALSPDSHINHLITLHNPSFHLRFTNFIEIMAPCFSRAFLLAVLPTFKENLSGWGLDYLWATMVPDWKQIAIIDAVTVRHTRPITGPNYSFLAGTGKDAYQEMSELMAKYKLSLGRLIVRGGIDRSGKPLSMFDASAVELIENIISGYRCQLTPNSAGAIMDFVRPNLDQLGAVFSAEDLAKLKAS